MYLPRFAYYPAAIVACAVFLTKCADIHGKPMDSSLSIDRFDYTLPYNQPLSDYGLHRLRRGYYYIDNGRITAVPQQALAVESRAAAPIPNDRIRQRSIVNGNDRVFDSVLQYRETHASRKKLFVPNLFG